MSEDSDLHRRTQAIWEHNATFWDEYFGEGNDFHRGLVAPAAEKLLALDGSEDVLEIACGNGAFARQMARLGCHVVATDFAATFVARARERSTEYTEHIVYRQVDATDSEQLASLSQLASRGRFGAIVCNMALMDMSDIAPLWASIPTLLAPAGRFVFTIMHPCFNNPAGTRLVAEQEDREGEIVVTRSIKVHSYLTPSTNLGIGIRGQPEPQYYFHRSLTDLLSGAFANGLVVDGLLEPAFVGGQQGKRDLSWGRFSDIPAVLAVRLRLASQ